MGASRHHRLIGAGAGLLAAGTALATGELVAGLGGTATSPVIAVGDAVIDRVPRPVKDLAIDLFGTGDKTALLVGIYTIVGLVAVAVGVLATRRLAAGSAVVAGFGAVGAAAGAGSGAAPVLASVIGAAAGIAVLVLLLRPPPERYRRVAPPASGISPEPPPARLARRRFLLLGTGVAAVAAGGATLGRFLQSQAGAAASRAAVLLPAAARPRPPVPRGADLGVAGVGPFLTPNDRFYRIDVNLLAPQVPAEGWALRITGRVDHELTIPYDELLARPLVEEDITLSCVSNEVGGDLVGNARWLGVPLLPLLEEAGVDRSADQVVGRAVDGFTTGFPVDDLRDGRPALVALGMNGEPLPIRHGFPARLVVAGLYGYVSATKWLAEIELTRFADFDQYWVRRGWAPRAPVKTMARIDTPRPRRWVGAGVVPVAGVAWAPGRGIERVEVRVDDGAWQEADLGAVPGDNTWRQWVFRWHATPGTHRLTARATDGTGAVQTGERSSPFPDGATGWHTVEVPVEAA